jgi:3-phytase
MSGLSSQQKLLSGAIAVQFAALLAVSGCTAPSASSVAEVRAAVATDPVPDDPDDPAIWVHPTDSNRSLIVGTNKVKAPSGALLVFGLDGKVRQTIGGLDRPNNVDIEYGLQVGAEQFDIAVVTERLKSQLRVFRIASDGSGLTEVTALGNTRVFADRSGEQAAPMGVSLYRRPKDGAMYAIVAPKNGPRSGYLAQYRLEHDGQGKVRASLVRYFGGFSGTGEIEAVAVDDALGYVYYADEGNGIHKYHADPDHPDAARELAHFGKTGFKSDREGIAIYARADGTGYVVCTDQIENNSEYHVYSREGEPGRPHDHNRLIKTVRGGADTTDGLEITSRAIARFQSGLVVAMNSKSKNFLLYSWEDFANGGAVKLAKDR